MTLSPSLQGCRYLRWAGRYNVSISPQLRCHTPKLGSPWQSRPTPMDSTRSMQEREKREILRFCRKLNSHVSVGLVLLVPFKGLVSSMISNYFSGGKVIYDVFLIQNLPYLIICTFFKPKNSPCLCFSPLRASSMLSAPAYCEICNFR